MIVQWKRKKPLPVEKQKSKADAGEWEEFGDYNTSNYVGGKSEVIHMLGHMYPSYLFREKPKR